MPAGQMIGDTNGSELAPPDDTGEAVGLLPSRLTETFASARASSSGPSWG